MSFSGGTPDAGLQVQFPISVLVTPVTSNTMVIAVPSTVHCTLYVAVVESIQPPIIPSYDGGVHCPQSALLSTPVFLCNRSGQPSSPTSIVHISWKAPPSVGYLLSAVSDTSLEAGSITCYTYYKWHL